MLRLFPWPSQVLHFMRTWLLLPGMETTAQVKTPWAPAPKSLQIHVFVPPRGYPWGARPPPRWGWPRGPRKEKPAGRERGETRVPWLWPQPLREKEPFEGVASTGLACFPGNAAPDHLSWLVISSSAQFVGGKTLREAGLFEKPSGSFLLRCTWL